MVKTELKAAKQAIESNDPETALYYTKDVLQQDPKNYYALIFEGKAHQLNDNLAKACASYEKAIAVDGDNLLGWKGLFQATRLLSPPEPLRVIAAATGLGEVQHRQEVLSADTARDVKNYFDTIGYKQNPELLKAVLEATVPGTPFADLMGNALGTPLANLEKLVAMAEKDVSDRVAKLQMKERVKLGQQMPPEQRARFDAAVRPVLAALNLTKYYDDILAIADDAQVRCRYREAKLRHLLEVLKSAADKPPVYAQVREAIDDMVTLKVPLEFGWTMYLDWADFAHIGAAEMPVEHVVFYLQHFPELPVALMLYAYVLLDMSDYDQARIVRETGGAFGAVADEGEETEGEGREDTPDLSPGSKDQDNQDVDTQDSTTTTSTLLPDQVLEMMVHGYQGAKKLLFANRLVCSYYLHIREYREALARCQELIRVLAATLRTYGVDNFLPHTKTDFLRTLAMVYTYFEAPKNFARALQLYDSILGSNSHDVPSRVGKGVILMEKGDYDSAHTLLADVAATYPDNTEAVAELAWCDVRLGRHEQGREGLARAIAATQGTDVTLANLRATMQWRLALSYEATGNHDQAHATAVAALKLNPNYAPAYTLLGQLYATVFGDEPRAHKCFYKAIELDTDEVAAARYLVGALAARGDDDVADILCTQVVELATAKRRLHGDSWPFRVLGSHCLNRLDDAKAVEWFQLALRMNAGDALLWTGLGEAYYHCGKLEAAAKVFRHVLALFDPSWHVHYLLGRVLADLGEFSAGLAELSRALDEDPGQECVLAAVYEAYLDYAAHLVGLGYVGRALAANSEALATLVKAKQANRALQGLWKLVSQAVRVYAVIQQRAQVPWDHLQALLGDVEPVDGVSYELAAGAGLAVAVARLQVLLAAEGQRQLGPRANKYLRLAALYNVGIAFGALAEAEAEAEAETTTEAEGETTTDTSKETSSDDTSDYWALAIAQLKLAIAIEASNPLYWTALGNCYFGRYPTLAQHCYIKATTLESHDALVWINLAALYLTAGDDELAHQAFSRAQLVAPANALAWLGNAIVLAARGEPQRAHRVFAHAYIVANGKVPVAQALYGLLTLGVYAEGASPHDIATAQEMLLANFAMQKYLAYAPEDFEAQAVAANVGERCSDYRWARGVAEGQVAELEARYERDETEANVVAFAAARAQLARVQLGLGLHREAEELVLMVLDLVAGAEPRIELSCRVTLGLCAFFNGDFDTALTHLQAILEVHPSQQRLVVLVAQILHAFGTADTRQAALDQLFGYVDDYGSAPTVVLVLAAMSLHDDLTDVLAPVREELAKLELADLIKDVALVIPEMVAAINHRLGASEDAAWQRLALLTPWNHAVWSHLLATMALQVAELRENKVRTRELAAAYAETADRRFVQRSLLLVPGTYI